MFEIGFLELVVVGLVALVVLGPEKLPGTIRTVSLWVGRLRRSFNTIKRDIEREIGADEIRRQLRNEEIMEKFSKTKSQVQNTIESVKKETEELRKSADLEAQVAALTSQGSDKTPDDPTPTTPAASTPPPASPAESVTADTDSADSDSQAKPGA